MKLPSINQLFEDSRKAFIRFPVVLILALVGTAAALILVDYEGSPQPTILFPILFTAGLGLPLFTMMQLTGESRKLSPSMAWTIHTLGILLLLGYGALIPMNFVHAPAIHIIRFVILAAILVLAVLVIPFSKKGEWNGFWQYGKALFLRALTAFLFTHVLWIGLAIALMALDNLFGFTVPGKRYGELWIFLNGIFCVWFFLADVPEDLHALESVTDYPKGLRIFAQYILTPLVLVYFVILYAYLLKIVFVWDWPEGWVSKLILGFAGVGIFSLLLLHPVSSRDEKSWVKTALRWFYPALVPVLVMLFLAVWRRVSEYGWTEGRYMAIALGVWLALLSGYFMLSKTKSIKVIFASLGVLLLVVSVGPWSVFSVSEGSQIGRLKAVLSRDSILVENKIRAQHPKVSIADAKEISAIVTYLQQIHGYGSIAPWFGESLMEDSTERAGAALAPAVVTGKMGVEYTYAWRNAWEKNMFISSDNEAVSDIRTYDFMVRGVHLPPDVNLQKKVHAGLSYRVNKNLDTLTLTYSSEGRIFDTLNVGLRDLVLHAVNDSSAVDLRKIPLDRLTTVANGTQWRAKIIVRSAFVMRQEAKAKIEWYNIDVLYSSTEPLEKPQ